MGLDNRYDGVFKQYAQIVPVTFMRVLGKKESGLDPDQDAGRGKSPNAAKGLFQITGIVRLAYNKACNAMVGVQDLFDPALNTRIAAWVLGRIMLSYGRNHPASLSVNWNDPRWVALLVFGWNAGFSESSGVGYVARLLESRGSVVTVDTVLARASIEPVVSQHVKNPAKAAWSKGVAAAYFAEKAAENATRRNA